VVIGHYNSSSTLAAILEYGQKRTLMITPTSTNAGVTNKGYPTVFRVCGRDDQQAATAAAYVVKYFPGATVALLHDKSPYGDDLANQFLRDYQSKTGKGSVYYGGMARSAVDFSTTLAKLKETNPGVIYYGGLFLQGAALLKDIRAAGITAPFVTGDGCFDPAFITGAGAAAEGALVSFYPDVESTPSAKAVVSSYRAKFGKAPGPYTIFAYTAASVAFQAMEQAGSTDSLAVAKALHAGTFETPLGSFKFDEKGDPSSSPYVIWKVQGGAFVPVDMNAPAPPPPAEPAAPKP
jgi:branched-chain amino acid transport system substrate-binding protein